jgi:hypothetical protein
MACPARDHLYDTFRRQYGTDDAEILIGMLERSARDDWATKQDIDELRAATRQDIDELRAATRQDIDELRAATRQDLAELRADLKDEIHAQTRTFISWMFGLLTVYTAMAGSLVGIGIVIAT